MIKHVLKRTLSLLLAALFLFGLLPVIEGGSGGIVPSVSAASVTSGSGTWISGKLTYTYRVETAGDNTSGAAGSVSASGTTLTVRATNAKQYDTGGCDSTTIPGAATTTSVTVTNASSYPLLVNTLTLGGDAAVSGVSQGQTLAPGTTFSVSVTAPENGTNSTQHTGTAAISVTELSSVTITAAASPYVSYTLNGHTVAQNGSDVSFTVSVNTTITLPTITAPAGYAFQGWRIGSRPVTTAASFTADGNYTVYPAIVPDGSDTEAENFKVGNNTYAFWDEAIAAAVGGGGKVIVNQPTVTLPDSLAGNLLPASGGAYVKPVSGGGVEYVVPAGVTLLVPFDAAGTVYTATPAVVYGSHVMPTAFRTLVMPAGTRMTVRGNGSVCVNSQLSSSGQMGGWNGTPTGPDGRIKMQAGSAITLESGSNLYCWGYIYGSGSVEALSGSTVYEAFQIKDWRGGTATSNVYGYAFIFNQYYIQNIEVPLKLNAGASEKLYSSVNASSSAYPMSATFLGSGGLFTLSSGYIIKDYIEATDRLQVDVWGSASVSTMTLTGLPTIGSISTGNYVLPITSNVSIYLHSGASTITQDLELLPSTEICIDRGASLQINSGKRVYVYDESDWGNFSGSTRMYPIGYSAANGTATLRTAAGLTDAKIDVNGTLNVAGSLYTSSGGGNITSSLGTENGAGKVVFSTAPTASSTIYEMEGNSTKTAVTFYAPHFRNGDESYSDSTGTGTSTWYYDKDGEHWYRFLVDFVLNGNRVGRGWFCENNSTVSFDISWLSGAGASVTSGSASAAISGNKVNVTNVTSNATVTLTGTPAKFLPTFVLNEKEYQNYRHFTGNTISETREINGETWYVVSQPGSALDVGAACAAPTDAAMGVTPENHNAIVWNLTGVSATSGLVYTGTVPVGETPNGEVYIYGFYSGSVAYNSATDQYYPTLKAALLDVPQTGTCTVRLIADCGSFEEESGEEALTVLEGSNLTLDLNGFHALGSLTNNGNLTLELNGGLWEYHTGATAAAAAYQGKAAVTNNGALTVQDTAGGGRITADAVSNSGIPNHAAVIRNNQSGTLTVTGGTLENLQDVNNYTSLVLNDRGVIPALQNVTLRSPRGYAVFNYGGQIAQMDSCDIDVAYGIYNRNVRGANTIAVGYNIANYGVIDTIQNCVVTAGQHAIYNSAVINLLDDCTFTAHPDSAQVNTYGTAGVNVQGNVYCYTVYNSGNWWYDTNVWKRTDNTASSYVRTDEYREEEEYRPTIGTIRDCRIYAENTSASADYGGALYNSGGVIGTLTGTNVIRSYKHPDNPKSISSNFALRNTAGGIIHSITGNPEVYASGTGAFYNDGQFTTRTVNFYGDKIGGIQLHNQTTYGAPSLTETVNCSGSFAAGGSYGIMNSGRIGTLTGGFTVSANVSALLNSGAGACSSYEFVRTYTSNTDSTTETKRVETYVRNLTDGGLINTIDGVHFVGTGSNSYYLLQNQGKIGSLKNSDFTAASPRAGESYAMILNGDSRQSGHTLTREPYACESLWITPYEYHYDYDVAEINEIDNITVTKNASYGFRNLGRINSLKNSSFTGTQYVFLNTTSGPYVERDYVRYYSGASKFATTRNNGSDLTTAYTRVAAEIGTLLNNSFIGTSTYLFYNGGHLGTLIGNSFSSTNTTVFYNGGASIRSFASNMKDVFTVVATDSACTVTYGNDPRVNVTDYDAPVIDLIGPGNHLSGTYQVLVNLGVITAINGGADPVTVTSTTQKQVGGIYSYAGTLDARTATTPYTDGTAGTAVNEDTYLNAHIGSIKNTVVTANGVGIQNGSGSAAYLPVIDELGEGLEVHANCTTAGYHAVLNTACAKIAAITGGIYDAAKATTNAYRNNNTDAACATLISGGDFKGMAVARANAIYEPDNTDRQTYPDGKSLSTGTETVTLHDGATAEGYYFIGATVTVTFDANGGSGTMEPQTAAADKAFSLNPNAFTRQGYVFTGWNTQADGQGTAYADGATLTLSADLTLYAQWRAVRLVDVYFVDQDGNAAACAYAFGSGVENAAFPGVTLTAQGTDENGDNWYKLTLDANVYTNVIFSGGSNATQTSDLGLGTGTYIVYYINNGSAYEGADVWPAPPAEVAATCTQPGSVTYTGLLTGATHVTTLPALGHDWSDWTVTAEATCTATGTETRTCSRCGGTETRAIDALGHAYVDTVTAPTCTTGGFTTHTCSRCGDSYTDTPVDALGHDWSAWTSATPATCTEGGQETRSCSRCNAVETRAVAALGHDYAATVTAPTCTAAGFTTHTCSRCGDTYTDSETPALGHDWGDWATTTEPTCTETGVKTRTCSRCDAVETETLEALGHAYVATVTEPTCTAAGYTTHTCSRCGDTYTYTPVAALGHDYAAVVTEPTCLAAGYTTHTCSRCGDTYTDSETPALGHDWSDWATTTEPTCTETGVKTRTCSRCDASETETLAALGHAYVATVTEPTCTAAGYTTHTCSRCGDPYTDSETAALGHDWSDWATTTEPTCTETGVKTRTCSRCDASETETLAALGHAYVETVTEPTCTAAGYTTHTCSRCGDTYTDSETPALGHDWSDWATTTEPTCTETGVKTRSCSRCDAVETETLAALGHVAGEAVQENYTEPTATADGGYDTVTYCQRCGAELSREHTVLPATGPTEPIETADLHIYNSISVGTDMVITFSARKSDLTNYSKFWIEVVKHNPDGDVTYRYGADEEGGLSDLNPDGSTSSTWKAQFRNIYAKEMGIEVEARLYAENDAGQIYRSPARNANIRDYLGGRLTAANNKVEQRVLAADMLNYGAAAQMFTDFQTDHLVNREISNEALAKLHQYETTTLPAVNKTNTNYRPEGQSNILFNSVTLGNEVLLNLTVRLAEGTEGVQILVKDHETGEVVTTLDTIFLGSTFNAVFNGIGADKMRTEYDFVTTVNGVETGNIRTWSVEAYVGEIRTEGIPLKVAMANALLTYGDSAAAYFAAQ